MGGAAGHYVGGGARRGGGSGGIPRVVGHGGGVWNVWMGGMLFLPPFNSRLFFLPQGLNTVCTRGRSDWVQAEV